jgi:hypothetical protein
MEFFPMYNKPMPFSVYISRMETVGSLHHKIVLSLKGQSKLQSAQDHPIRFLLEWSRLWKVEWGKESLEDLPKLV